MLNNFVLHSVQKATIYDLNDKSVKGVLEQLKTTGVENTATTTWVTGGPGGARITSFSSNREARLPIEDAVFTKETIELLSGNKNETGVQTVTTDKKLIVATGGKVTLPHTPESVRGVYAVNEDGTKGASIKFTTPVAKELTLTDAEKGDEVWVFYETKTGADATKMGVTSDGFGKSFEIRVDCLARDTKTEVDYRAQLVVYKGRFENDFTISINNEGEVPPVSMNIDIMKAPKGTAMWDLITWDDSWDDSGDDGGDDGEN